MHNDVQYSMVAGTRGPQRPYPHVPVHELVWRQASRTPHATAVRHGGRQVTYAQLRAAAQQAAACLRARRLGPGTVTALLLEPGIDLAIAVLGVLSAGGAYMVLGAGTSRERLAGACRQAGASAAVTTTQWQPLLPAGMPVLTSWQEAGQDEGEASAVSPGDGFEAPCAVVFTSGTTGAPKAVAASHRNVVAAVAALLHTLGAGRWRSCAVTTGLSGAAGLAGLWPPLVTGGAVIMTGGLPAAAAGPSVLDGVTLVHAAPVALAGFLRGQTFPATVRTLVTGGAPLPAGLADEVFARTSVSDIYHGYCAAEAATYATMQRIVRGGQLPVTLGLPLDNVTAAVLDSSGSPCPPGQAGELVLGGPTVTSGYLGRPDLTRQAFRPVTLAGTTQPMYHTADLCRALADGRLEFLGRMTSPGGTEDPLGEHTAPGDGPASLPAGGQQAAPPPHGHSDPHRQFLPPRSGTEREIAGVYSAVLQAPRVGALDDFYDLGGSSLEAAVVIGRIRQCLGVTVPMADFMAVATVEAIAQIVDEVLLSQVTAADLAAAAGPVPGLPAPTEAHNHG